MEEIWKDVVGFEGRYKVSNLGNVKSVIFKKNGAGKKLALLNGKDYTLVRLYKNGEGSMQRVHRLVAEAFIDNPNCYPVVNHKNWNKRDNRVENLEWCSYSYNNSHKARISDPSKSVNTRSKATRSSEFPRKGFAVAKRVVCIETGETYESMSVAAKSCNIEQSNISRCCRGVQRTAGSYHWKYVDEDDRSIGTLTLATGEITPWILATKSENQQIYKTGLFELSDIQKYRGRVRFIIKTTLDGIELCLYGE